MYRKIFVCLCRRRICTIFNTVHAMSGITYINFKTFEEYLRELERAETDRQTERINTFQICWKVLKSGRSTQNTVKKAEIPCMK